MISRRFQHCWGDVQCYCFYVWPIPVQSTSIACFTILETKKLVMKETPMQKNDEDMFAHLTKKYYIYSERASAKVDCHDVPTVTILPKRANSGELGYIDAGSMQV